VSLTILVKWLLLQLLLLVCNVSWNLSSAVDATQMVQCE
jgi:hypothetical protein